MKNTNASNPVTSIAQAKAEHKSRFAQMLRDYENAVNAENEREYVDIGYKLAQIEAIQALKAALEHAEKPSAREKLEKELRLARIRPLDCDTVSEAITALWQMTRKFASVGGKWLETDLTLQKWRKRVITCKDKAEFVTYTITPIQYVRRAANRYIRGERGASYDISMYTFVQLTEAIDGAADDYAIDILYYRTHKAADVLESDGPAELRAYDALYTKIREILPAKYGAMIPYLAQNLSYADIGKVYGISKQATAKRVEYIRRILRENGIQPHNSREVELMDALKARKLQNANAAQKYLAANIDRDKVGIETLANFDKRILFPSQVVTRHPSCCLLGKDGIKLAGILNRAMYLN